LVWSNWKAFMGEKQTDDTTEYVIPTVSAPASTGFVVGSLWDCFGLPTGIQNLEVSALFSRGYNLIVREWFIDQNLMGQAATGYPVVDVDNGPDTVTDYVLRRRCKRPDYFTSCLPWAQKSEAVSLPLGTTAPVIGNNVDCYAFNAGASADSANREVRTATGNAYVNLNASAAAAAMIRWGKYSDRSYTGLEVDLSDATAATINSLREAFQLQKLLERDARGGTRYAEVIMSHFGVTDPQHAVLQRPVYLGGGSQPLSMHMVPQTSATGATGTPQANLSAYGIGASTSNGFTQSFTEHGMIIGLLNVRADLTYQQGLNRMWSRSTKYDFYWPALAHLGEQSVLNKEIYAQDPTVDTGSTGTPDNERVFGYQERYAEYRYGVSQITGELRSTFTTPLDVWHLAQEFSALPTLGRTFIEDTPPIDRISAVTTAPHFVADTFTQCHCVRPMPVYSVPGLIDHF